MFNSTYGNSEPNFFAGGGTQFGTGGGFMPSQAEPTQAPKKFHQQTLRAVTIKQIKQATANLNDDNIIVDGEDLNNVTLVGRVVNLTENSTNLDMQVDDGTGQMEVKLYVDADDESTEFRRRQCEPGHYIRVHGHLRPMDNKYPLIAFHVRQISDYNEVTFHFLQSIYQHAHFTKGTARNQNAPPSSAMKPMGGQQRGVLDDGPPLQQAVLQVYNTSRGDITIQQVADSLNGKYSIKQVRDAVQDLTDQGMVYSVSEDVFKSIQNC